MVYKLKHLLFAAFFSIVSTRICTALCVMPNPKWKNYHITGIATSFGSNFWLVYGTRDINFRFTFEDADGNRAYAPFKLNLLTAGACFNLSDQLYFAKFVGSNLTLLDAANHPIKITAGSFVEITSAGYELFQIFWKFFPPLPSLLEHSGFFKFFGFGAQIVYLENHKGFLFLFGPIFVLSFAMGDILGGSLEMIAEPTFYDAQAQDRPLKSKPA